MAQSPSTEPSTASFSAGAVSATALKLPTIWTKSPEAWFRIAEAQFALKRITTDQTKFDYLITAITEDLAIRFRQQLEFPPAIGKYQALKDAILKKFKLTDFERAERLMGISELGDRLPSDLMQEMLNLHGGRDIDYLFKWKFLSLMPDFVRTALVDCDWGEATETALRADHIYRSRAPTDVSQLCKVAHRAASPPRDRETFNKQWCYFHNKFGNRARKCTKPCSFSENEQAGRQ